ncbi:MAG: ChaN family lipoprotein, partial [Deltaproteobacteria bacterium]|nr:ChaN family lipoprotein [Deltaproteobacteria bacterium]
MRTPSLLLALAFCVGCAGGSVERAPWPADAVAMPYPPEAVVPGLIVHAATGRTLSETELLDLAAEHRAIYVGEAHDNLAAHRVQAAIVKGLVERHPGKVVVGMEMFPTTAQEELDAYHAGQLSEEEFGSLWRESWEMDPAYYQPLFDVIREQKIPIVGLNLPSEIIETVARGGVEALTPEERRTLPAIGPVDPYQRAMLDAVFAGHSAGSGQMERFLLVQQLWDESMAQRAAAVLRDEAREGTRLIVIAGGYHVAFGVGIPRRLFRRVPLSYL